MVDKIGWMFEESSSLGIVNNDNAAVSRFDGSIKTFLREAIQNSADALWPRVTDDLTNVEINIKIRKLTGRTKTNFLNSLKWEDLKEHFEREYEGEAQLGNTEAEDKRKFFFCSALQFCAFQLCNLFDLLIVEVVEYNFGFYS